MKNKLKLSNRAFSLIEIIIALIIIGILVFLARPKYLDYLKSAHYSQIIADTYILEDLTRSYIVKKEKDPASLTREKFELEFVDILEGSHPQALYLPPGIESFGGYKIDGRLGLINPGLEHLSHVGLEDLTGYYKLSKEDYIDHILSTKLKGDFYVNKLGEIVYIDGHPKLEREDLGQTMAWQDPFLAFSPLEEETSYPSPETRPENSLTLQGGQEEVWTEPEDGEVFEDDGRGRFYFVYVNQRLIDSWTEKIGYQKSIAAYNPDLALVGERAYMDRFIDEELRGNCLIYKFTGPKGELDFTSLERLIRSMPTYVRVEDLDFCDDIYIGGSRLSKIYPGQERDLEKEKIKDLRDRDIDKVKLVGFAPSHTDYYYSASSNIYALRRDLKKYYSKNEISDFKFKNNLVYFGDSNFISLVKFTGDLDLNKTKYIASYGLASGANLTGSDLNKLEFIGRDGLKQPINNGNVMALGSQGTWRRKKPIKI